MTTKRDIIRAGYDSLNANSSGDPDVDRQTGILPPEDFLPIASTVDEHAARRASEIRSTTRRHPSNPKPAAPEKPQKPNLAVVTDETTPDWQPTQEEKYMGKIATRLIRDVYTRPKN